MFCGDDSGGVQWKKIGVKNLTKKFESFLVGRNCNPDGRRCSLRVTKHPHRSRTVCPSCGEQFYYLQDRKDQADQEPNST